MDTRARPRRLAGAAWRARRPTRSSGPLLRRWTGAWRIAAGAAPARLGDLGRQLRARRHPDPTSHNLFPFEVLIGAAVALLYLGPPGRGATARGHGLRSPGSSVRRRLGGNVTAVTARARGAVQITVMCQSCAPASWAAASRRTPCSRRPSPQSDPGPIRPGSLDAERARAPTGVARLVAAASRWYRLRRDARQLMAFDDRMLQDIGLSRGEIESAVAGPDVTGSDMGSWRR